MASLAFTRWAAVCTVRPQVIKKQASLGAQRVLLSPRQDLPPANLRQHPRQALQIAGVSSGRSVHYEDGNTYVWIESGKDEEFLTLEELSSRLQRMLASLPQDSLPSDLSRFSSLDEAVEHLIDSACELSLPGSMGTFQWFSVRIG